MITRIVNFMLDRITDNQIIFVELIIYFILAIFCLVKVTDWLFGDAWDHKSPKNKKQSLYVRRKR